MSDERRSTALAIKRCLESLTIDARRDGLGDLAEFLGLAVSAAEEAAAGPDTRAMMIETLMQREPCGHC
ncbi:MAG TPA: hypothetical protein VED40_08340 [Azospirillaceae bacterium]|nr:hypothetical protein [Azospirillaceae bacterium]